MHRSQVAIQPRGPESKAAGFISQLLDMPRQRIVSLVAMMSTIEPRSEGNLARGVGYRTPCNLPMVRSKFAGYANHIDAEIDTAPDKYFPARQ